MKRKSFRNIILPCLIIFGLALFIFPDINWAEFPKEPNNQLFVFFLVIFLVGKNISTDIFLSQKSKSAKSLSHLFLGLFIIIYLIYIWFVFQDSENHFGIQNLVVFLFLFLVELVSTRHENQKNVNTRNHPS